MENILLVEDSVEFQLIVRKTLESSAREITTAGSFDEVTKIIHDRGVNFQLAILDLSLPDGDGFQVLTQLRQAGMPKETPVFFLTVESELDSKVTAFNLGADDYLVKPIDPLELRARVEMRLAKAKTHSDETIERGSLVLQIAEVRASRRENGQLVDLALTSKEFKLLSFLLRSENKVFSRSELVENVWGQGLHVLDRTVDSHIYGLRKKMGPIGNYVECIPQVGYQFKLPTLVKVTSAG